jgi:hypothetical protein
MIKDILNKFEAKGPPWGAKLTPTAMKELESLLIDMTREVYKAAYEQGVQDAKRNQVAWELSI